MEIAEAVAVAGRRSCSELGEPRKAPAEGLGLKPVRRLGLE